VNEDFRDLLHALLDSGARFLVVGAHAMAVHGVPRATGDLDVWIEATPSNADRVWSALTAFGAPVEHLGISRGDLLRPDTVVQIGLPPRRLDILTSITGIDFSVAWPERVETLVEGRPVPVLGRRALVQNKQAAGRRKDLSDLEALGELPPSGPNS